MNKLREQNIQKTIWHLQRQRGRLAKASDLAAIKSELFHLQSSIDCLIRILNDQNPYPGIDREDVF